MVIVIKLNSGHSIIGQLIKDKWKQLVISRPFAVERRVDLEGNMAEVLTPYTPYIKHPEIVVNKSSIVTYYEVNDVFSNFYFSTLDGYLKNTAPLSDKAIKEFLEQEEKEYLEVIYGPTSNTVH